MNYLPTMIGQLSAAGTGAPVCATERASAMTKYSPPRIHLGAETASIPDKAQSGTGKTGVQLPAAPPTSAECETRFAPSRGGTSRGNLLVSVGALSLPWQAPLATVARATTDTSPLPRPAGFLPPSLSSLSCRRGGAFNGMEAHR